MPAATVRVAKPAGLTYQVVIEAGGARLATLSVSAAAEGGHSVLVATELSHPLPAEQVRAFSEMAAAAVLRCSLAGDLDIAPPEPLARARPTAHGDAIVPGLVGAAQLPLLTAHRKRYGFARQFCRHKRVLDLACGAGYGARMLALVAARVVAADFDEQAVGEAAWRFARENIAHLCADGTRLALPDAAFDVVVSFETIEHLWPEQVALFLGELRRVLAPGGTLVLSTPRVEGAPDPEWGLVNLTGEHQRGHQVGFSAATLEAWLRRFFAHVVIFYQGSQRPQDDPVPQLELWAAQPAFCETLVALASDTALDVAGCQRHALPLNLYEPEEVERFLAHPDVAVVHATLEKRGRVFYAAFALAHERPGDKPPAYFVLDYVRVTGLEWGQPRLVFPPEGAAAVAWAEHLGAILADGFERTAYPEQTFSATLPPASAG